MNARGKTLPPVEKPNQYLNFDRYAIISSQIQRSVQFLEKNGYIGENGVFPDLFHLWVKFCDFWRKSRFD